MKGECPSQLTFQFYSERVLKGAQKILAFYRRLKSQNKDNGNGTRKDE